MDILLAHATQHWTEYAAVAAVLLPLLYFTRRYSLPVILWTCEFFFYLAVMHVVLHYFVQIVKWFKLSTIPHYAERIDPGWETPLTRFWDFALYNPDWVYYGELLASLVILIGMYRLRPMRTQKPAPKRERYQTGTVPPSLRAKYANRSR